MLVFLGEISVFISIRISYQSYIVLTFCLFMFIIILTKLGITIVKRPRTILWMGRYLRN